MKNLIAIVGRPNVGKSTFFNRITGMRNAIMDDQPGVTRDRNYGYSEWCGVNFALVDTGGYVVNSDDIFEEQIRNQVKLALDEAAVIFFMVDITEGITDLDKDFAKYIRRSKKPVFLIANKADTPNKSNYAGEFYGLGMGEVYTVSSQNGSGTGELLDEAIKHMTPEHEYEDPYEGIPKVSILGRPNVGKSSFVNCLLGEDRSIVTDIAGTTRDSIDSLYNAYGKKFVITDTAGIRKKTKVKEDIEFYSVMRSIRSLEYSDVCVVMLDATQGIESQDLNILALAHKNKKGIVLVVNKWDLYQKDHNTAKQYEDFIKNKTMPIDYYPVIFTSVLNKQRIFDVLEKVEQVYESKTQKISTNKLNEVMLQIIENFPPPSVKSKYIKIKYVTQLPTKSPTFAFFCNLPQYVKDSYQRFLENKIRENFGFEGVPITLVFRKK
ncbi:MAG: ribosome biogenesis GTPase Der [Cytophagales bacterium]